MLGLFLAAVESTVVATAMPTIVSSLGGLTIYSWVFSAYLVSSTVTMPLWGRLSDLHGRKRFFVLGVTIFLLGSALCGMSRSMFQLIFFRFIQGLGAGAVMPLTFTIIGDIFSLEQRAKMQGLFSGVWGVASLFGPLVGGYVADHLSWRWVFYINVPFGIVAILLIALGLKQELPHPSERPALDLAGIFFFTCAVFSLLVGMSILNQAALQSAALFVLSAVLGAFYFKMEKRAEHPLIPLKLFKIPIFASAQAAGIFSGMAMFGTLSFIPLFMQSVLGSTATQAGRILLPFMLAWVLFSIVGGRALLRYGYRKVILAGGIFLLSGFVLMTFLRETSAPWNVALCMILEGAGMGFNMAPFLIAVQNAVPKELMGAATSSTQFVRTVGGAIGVSMMGGVLSRHLKFSAMQLIQDSAPAHQALGKMLQHPDALISPVTRGGLPVEILHSAQAQMASGLRQVFTAGLIFAVLSFIACWTVPSGSAQSHAHSSGG